MQNLRLACAIALLVLPCLGTASDASGPGSGPDIRISEIFPAPDLALGEREFVELLNLGNATVDLEGWKLRDAATSSGSVNTFTLPSWALLPGERLVVWGGGTGDGLGPAWSQASAWNNGGDAVHLVAPGDTVVDWVDYGATTGRAPDGFAPTGLEAPAKSSSWALRGEVWHQGMPSPGLAVPADASANATVSALPPLVTLGGPSHALPGASVALAVSVDDPNGGSDITQWQLAAGGDVLAQGAGATTTTVDAVAPQQGPWVVRLQATDAAGHGATAEITVTVTAGGLLLELPAQRVIRFPTLQPGDRQVPALDSFRIVNAGAKAVAPAVDFSAFAGNAPGARFAATGNLDIGLAAVDAASGKDNLTTSPDDVDWIAYEGPLTRLPELAPGAAWQATLRIRDVPMGLPAGAYGTSFAVVA